MYPCFYFTDGKAIKEGRYVRTETRPGGRAVHIIDPGKDDGTTLPVAYSDAFVLFGAEPGSEAVRTSRALVDTLAAGIGTVEDLVRFALTHSCCCPHQEDVDEAAAFAAAFKARQLLGIHLAWSDALEA